MIASEEALIYLSLDRTLFISLKLLEKVKEGNLELAE